ncbi:MAG TPA: ABC transporter substrate-binding protein [Syntrophorhabdales bacterium]|nr:ABC transporter substrate-binding protein [Syntrophorhabdales bacterium]
MADEKKVTKKPGMTRREFIEKTSIAGAALAFPTVTRRAFAAKKRDYILIGRCNPNSGPLSAFGETTPWIDDRILAEINKDGGIFIKEAGKKLPVRIKLMDTESDPTKAGDVASKLILQDEIDLMITLHTPDTVNPVDAMCERYQVPCISSDAPIESWLTGGPYKWSFHFFFSVPQIYQTFVSMWDSVADKTNKVVGGLWPNDPDGKTYAEMFTKGLQEKGYKVVDAGRFPNKTPDYTSFIDLWKKEKVEILTSIQPPPDFAAAWRQCFQQGFIPKMCTGGKPILFPSAVQAIGGNLPNGLTTCVWWSPYHPFKSSIAGYGAKALCDAWTEKTGRQWTQIIGFTYATFEVAADALKRAGTLDKEKIRQALAQTDLKTIVGPIKFGKENYAKTPMVGGQWAKGKKWPWELEIVENNQVPEIKKTAQLMFPIPRP